MLMVSVVCCSSVYGQSQLPVTITADSLVNGERNGQKVQQLVGHVQFAQGALNGTADRALQYLDQNRVELLGHVVIHQDTLSLEAPTVQYDGNSRVGHAEGWVTLRDREVTLTAENGDYDMGNQVAYFHHNVTVNQKTSTIKADDLTYYRATQTSIAVGGVVVRSDSGRLTADRVNYVKALDETTAIGNVHVNNDSLDITSDWLFNSRLQGTVFARGKVAVHSLANNTIIYGDTLARFAKLGYMSVPRNPLLYMIDSSQVHDSVTGQIKTRFDTMFVKSLSMEAYQGDSTRFIARDSARIFRTSGMSAIGGTLYYNERANLMTLSGRKREYVWSDSTQAASDSIAMLLNNRKLDRIVTVGQSFVTSPASDLNDPTRIDQLQGTRMIMQITQDTLRNVLVQSNALSLYFLANGTKPDGVNRASGDTIRIDFAKGTVGRVSIISGTEGEYFPERYVTGRASAFKLTAFERNLNLRPRREEFIPAWLPTSARTNDAPSTTGEKSKSTSTPVNTNSTTPKPNTTSNKK